MSFWDLTDGTKAESNETYESSGGDITPIPDKTGCIAAIEEAKWDSYEDDSYISLKWRVARPAEYANRVIFQKLKVYGTYRDKDPKAADKAKRMLAAIDANAGGKLMKLNAEPSDQDLMTALMGKMMAIKVMVWKIKGEAGEEDKKGNWISAVSPAKSAGTPPPPPKAKAPSAPVPVGQSASVSTDDFGDIPF